MKTRNVIPCVAALLIAACANSNGTYAPSCVALAGDRISLHDGRFEWDKFTDEVRVDANGNAIDPFPGYPVSGSFTRDGDTLHLTPDSELSLPDLHLVESDGRRFLLAPAAMDEWRNSGRIADCSLVLDTR